MSMLSIYLICYAVVDHEGLIGPMMQHKLEVAAIFIFELLLVTVFKLGCCL
jgi:hypothetical protein